MFINVLFSSQVTAMMIANLKGPFIAEWNSPLMIFIHKTTSPLTFSEMVEAQQLVEALSDDQLNQQT